MQNDFLYPEGSLWIGHDTKKFISDVEKLVDTWDGKIYGLLDTHDPSSCEFSQFPPHCVVDSWGHWPHPMYDKLSYAATQKHGYVSYNLMKYLSKFVHTSVFHFAGVLAHVCVLENIAALYNYSKENYNAIPKIKVNPLFVDDLTLDLKAQALQRMKNLYAVEIEE